MTDAHAATAPLIEFDRVSKDFGPARPVLREVSFTVERGQLVVLTGANGAGKSTVIQLIAGWLAPDGGRVLVAGEEPARLRGAALTALRRAIGIVPQAVVLLADRSVVENVMLPALAAGLSRRVAADRARAALQRVGLANADGMPARLSSGAQQRAALARAIVNGPALLLVDEPTACLDAAAAADFVRLLDDFAQAGVTIVMASHGDTAALPARARRLLLAEGRTSE
jgi:cell division transport system ATP-binding protein